MKQKRIAILLPDLRGGGAERIAVNLANAFVRRGYVVGMVLLSATCQLLSESLPEVRVVDLKISRLRWAIFPLVRYLRSVGPTVVLACISPLTVIALWVAVLASVCMVATEKYMNLKTAVSRFPAHSLRGAGKIVVGRYRRGGA